MSGPEENWGSPPSSSFDASPYGNFAGSRGSIWNDPEMQALLILLKEEADTNPEEFHNYWKAPLYRRVSERLRAIGFHRRPAQIRCKVKQWKSIYNNVLRQRAQGKQVTCRYFKDLMELFGDTPDKLGAEAAAEDPNDIVEVELSQGAAAAAARAESVNNDASQPASSKNTSEKGLQLQQPSRANRTAKKIVQRSLALQRLSKRPDGIGIKLSNAEITQSLYPSPEKADLVHLILLEDSADGSEDAWQSFLLENGLLKLQLIEEDFGLTRIKMKVGTHWVRLTADDNGYIPLSFTPDSSFVIKGIRTQETARTDATQNDHQTLNHIGNGEAMR